MRQEPSTPRLLRSASELAALAPAHSAATPRRVLLLARPGEGADLPREVRIGDDDWQLEVAELTVSEAQPFGQLAQESRFDLVVAPSCFLALPSEAAAVVLRGVQDRLVGDGFLVLRLLLAASAEQPSEPPGLPLEKEATERLLFEELAFELERFVSGPWRESGSTADADVGVLRRSPESLPLPPLELRRGIGDGSFWRNGRDTRDTILRLVGHLEGLRVLEIGSGLGRVAHFLDDSLGEAGSYDGFDVSGEYVNWCQQELGLDPNRFRFHHFDLASSTYNADGGATAARFAFPWPDGSFDLVLANSLFTHLDWESAANYLEQSRRVLVPGGAIFATFYLLDDESRPPVERGETKPLFPVVTDWGRVASADSPEDAVAFEAERLDSLITEELKLEVVARELGSWRGKAAKSFQDTLVLRRD